MSVGKTHPYIAKEYGNMSEESILAGVGPGVTSRDCTPLSLGVITPEDSSPAFELPQLTEDGRVAFSKRIKTTSTVKPTAKAARAPSSTAVPEQDLGESSGSHTVVNYRQGGPQYGKDQEMDTTSINHAGNGMATAGNAAYDREGTMANPTDTIKGGSPTFKLCDDDISVGTTNLDDAVARAFLKIVTDQKFLVIPAENVYTSSSTSDVSTGPRHRHRRWPPNKFEVALGFTVVVLAGGAIDLSLNYKTEEHFDRPVWILTAALLIFSTMGFHHVTKKSNAREPPLLPVHTGNAGQNTTASRIGSE